MSDRETDGGSGGQSGGARGGDPDGPAEEPTSDEAPSEEEWQFSLQDIDDREAAAAAAAEAEADRAEPIEAGTPSTENVAFVLLGVLLALFILSRLV
jgi:hypothetical protein